MGDLYFVSVDTVALVAATAKSVFEYASGANDRVKIVEWSVTGQGTSATAVPFRVEVGRFSAGVTTATTVTPSKMDPGAGPAAGVAKHSTTVEGAGTASDVLNFRVPATSGYVYQNPIMLLLPSTFFRIRVTAAATLSVTFHVVWDE